MSGKRVELVYTITKDALDMIKQGKAVLQSGGVRNLDGSLMELAVPGKQIVESGSAPIFSIPGKLFQGVNMVSSLANNIQSAYIQKGVNEANRKLDSLLKLQSTMMNELHIVAGLQVVNLALGFVNLGVSIKNFSEIKVRLNEVRDLLTDLSEHIHKKEYYDYIESYEKYSSYTINSIENLRHASGPVELALIPNSLSEIEAFLKKIIRSFNDKNIDGELGCTIIFGLVPCYVQAVKIYSANYYYIYHEIPNIYNKCIEVLDNIKSKTFRESMKRYLLVSHPEISMDNVYKNFSSIMVSIKTSANNLQFEKEVWEILPQKDYQNLDNIIQRKIMNNEDISYDEERAFITVANI